MGYGGRESAPASMAASLLPTLQTGLAKSPGSERQWCVVNVLGEEQEVTDVRVSPE